MEEIVPHHLYVSGEYLAPHPDYFYLMNTYNLKPNGVEKILKKDHNIIKTEKHNYILHFPKFITTDSNYTLDDVKEITSKNIVKQLMNNPLIEWIEITHPNKTTIAYYHITDNTIVPLRVLDKKRILYPLPDGYMTVMVEDLQPITTLEDFSKIGKIYDFVYTGNEFILKVLRMYKNHDDVRIVVEPFYMKLQRGAYTLEYRVKKNHQKIIEQVYVKTPFTREVSKNLFIIMPFLNYEVMIF